MAWLHFLEYLEMLYNVQYTQLKVSNNFINKNFEMHYCPPMSSNEAMFQM